MRVAGVLVAALAATVVLARAVDARAVPGATAATRTRSMAMDELSCVERVGVTASTCAMEVERAIEDGDGLARAVAAALERCGAAARMGGTAAAAAETDATIDRILERCDREVDDAVERCERDGSKASCVADALARVGGTCVSEFAAEVSACARATGSDDDRDDDPDDDCEAAKKALEEKCHAEYDEIKREIASGEISFVEGMKRLAAVGKQCAKDALALRKRCHPNVPSVSSDFLRVAN